MADLRRQLDAALGARYRIEREVRPLGNCRMFVAVAQPSRPAPAPAPTPELLVKALPAELSLGVDVARFERELLVLAERLNHAHLVAPQGGGRAGTVVYHTRRFVEGTTLRALLARHGEIPLRQAVEILRDLLGALAHAHAANVVHGDLKPENVLLADGGGGTLVVDTGIVDAVGRSLSVGAPGAPSAALCGAAYVAPERRSHGPPAGPRDDMFSVGVLVREMLTGKSGEPAAGDGEPLEEVRAVPAWLGELVRRCLATDPAGRWEDAAAALEILPRPSGQVP